MKNNLLDPGSDEYDTETASDALDAVCFATITALKQEGFIVPQRVTTTNLKNALWEIIGDANLGAEFEVTHPQRIRRYEAVLASKEDQMRFPDAHYRVVDYRKNHVVSYDDGTPRRFTSLEDAQTEAEELNQKEEQA